MLKTKVSIYVPSTYRNTPAPENVTNYYIKNTLKKLSMLYGGATAQVVMGSYYSDELNELITEKITIVYSYCNEYNRDDLVDVCQELKTVFMQESISLEINNTLEFI